MKEASPLRQQVSGSVYSSSARDLDVVFEENEHHHHHHQQQQQQGEGGGYQPSPPSLNFLRPKPTYSTPYSTATTTTSSSANDLNSSSSNIPTSSPLPSIVRRPRAGTMPSFILNPATNGGSMEMTSNRPSSNSPAALLLTTIEQGRNRSASFNLPPPPPPDASFWLRHDAPLSPSSEQLLQNDSDFSIARTMRSLGLEDDSEKQQQQEQQQNDSNNSGGGVINSLFHHQSPPEFHMPSRSLLSGNNRNRSYSVNATARYDVPSELNAPTSSLSRTNSMTKIAGSAVAGNNNMTFASPLEGFTRQQQNRPRASSMGRADAGSRLFSNLPLPMSGLWNSSTSSDRSSPLVSSSMTSTEEYDQQPSLSLGDSELLANILHNGNNASPPMINEAAVNVGNNNNMVYDQHDILPMEKPYMNYSQSTPTSFRDANNYHQQQQQVTTRSLWVGNIDNSITIDLLTQVFSTFGPIESVRLLVEKECGFVNFFQVEDAIRAKEEVLTRMGGRIGNCIVRIGFGKADAAVTETNVLQTTRALWLGNIPGNTTPTSLQNLFTKYGAIESVRVLSHKNCGFINFETVESAVAARDALLQNEIGHQGFTGARVGFAKIPPLVAPSLSRNNSDAAAEQHHHQESSSATSSNHGANSVNENLLIDATTAWQNDLFGIMTQFNMTEEVACAFVKDLKISSVYFDSIPVVPELSPNRQFDAARLREMRKRADSASKGKEEAEAIAQECMEDIAEISSDYIGNTVVQRLFEKCSEETKTQMLERIAPHLAAISIHKNGTWATQKIIDLAKTPEQIRLISQNLKPYIPPLLLDQFGNYAVQCCLRYGDPEKTQFIFDAMVEKVMNIAQGRFGARSMRGILESEFITSNQQKFVASSLCQNAVSLSTNANGALLLSWLIESTDIDYRLQVIATRLIPHLPQLCVHKLGSQIIYKLINQVSDDKAQEMILYHLMHEPVLTEVLVDQVRGLVFIQKVIICPALTNEQKANLSSQVCTQLEKLDGPGHKKLLDLLLEVNRDDNNTH